MTDEQEVEEAAEALEVLLMERDEPVDDFPAAAKRMLGLAEGMDWVTHNVHSVVHRGATFIKTGDRAGEPKKAAHDTDYFWISGASRQHRMGFVASWKRERKEKASNTFVYARITDPVGQPVELYFDYKPVPVTRDPKETEASWEARVRRNQRMCDEQHADYNDGTSYVTNTWLAANATEFTNWLKTWAEMLTKGAAA